MAAAEKVTRLPGAEAIAPREGKVLNIELTVNIGGDRQARILTDIPEDAPLGEQHARFDRVMTIIDRQIARANLREMEITLRNKGHEEQQKVEAGARKRTELELAVKRATLEFTSTCDAEERKHQAAGKRGEFDVDKNQPARAKAAALAAAQKTLEDFDVQERIERANYEKNVQTLNELIARKRQEIDALAAVD